MSLAGQIQAYVIQNHFQIKSKDWKRPFQYWKNIHVVVMVRAERFNALVSSSGLSGIAYQ